MRRLARPKPAFFIVMLLTLVAAGVVAQHFRLFERGWFNFQTWRHPADERSIGLGDYRVSLQAVVIDGLDDNVSALTYDPVRKSLFTVTNKNAELIELSLDGKILRRIPLVGFGDAEAVEFISDNIYVISDESQQRLIKVHVNDDTQFLDAADAEQMTLGVHIGGNNGFEGLAYDSVGKRLFVAKERDLSSLQYDERSGHLLALSDESFLVLELGLDGRPLSSLSLLNGRHGLEKRVPQAEGIAMDDEGSLYVVSEPNLFYVFKKP